MLQFRILCLAAAAALGAGACTGDRSSTLHFRVAVGDLPTGSRRTLAAEQPVTDTLDLVLPGTLYDPPRVTRLLPWRPDGRDSIEHAVDMDFSALKQGDGTAILHGFAAADQPDVRQFLADTAIRNASRRRFVTIDSMLVYAIARHDTPERALRLVFYSFGETGPRHRNVMVYVWERNAWQRTNDLPRDDHTVQQAAQAFRYGTITVR